MQHDTLTRRAVHCSLGVMALLMLLVFRDFSMSGDEASQIQIGRNTYVYLCRTLGFLPGSTASIKLDNYSGLFGVITTNLAYWMPWADEILLRHFIIAITGFFSIVYAGKTARLLWGRTAELLTIWLLFCSPRFFGASMNNSKDIPFSLGMMMLAYFLLRIAQSAPRIERKHFIGLFFALFIAIGVRIGGLPFCGVYCLVTFIWLTATHWRNARPYVQRLALWLTGTGLLAFLTAIIFLPKVSSNIPLGTLKALRNFSNYHLALTMLYNGRDIPTSEPPWHYLPVWVGITIPIVVLLLFAAALLLIARGPRFQTLLLLGMVLFPWLLIVVNHSPVYDAWRQFYFIYPPLVVLAGGAAGVLWNGIERPVAQLAFTALFIAGLLPPVLWSIRWHPLENVYFNEAVGGAQGAYGRFETDYYGEAVALACKKLLRQPAFSALLKDSIYVADNVPSQVVYYLKKANPRIAVRHLLYDARESGHWDYALWATRGIDSFRRRGDWPPAGNGGLGSGRWGAAHCYCEAAMIFFPIFCHPGTGTYNR